MTSWLDDPADLIRYDAVSVLAIHGGTTGHEVLMSLRLSGKAGDPRIRAILDQVHRKATEPEDNEPDQ